MAKQLQVCIFFLRQNRRYLFLTYHNLLFHNRNLCNYFFCSCGLRENSLYSLSAVVWVMQKYKYRHQLSAIKNEKHRYQPKKPIGQAPFERPPFLTLHRPPLTNCALTSFILLLSSKKIYYYRESNQVFQTKSTESHFSPSQQYLSTSHVFCRLSKSMKNKNRKIFYLWKKIDSYKPIWWIL